MQKEELESLDSILDLLGITEQELQDQYLQPLTDEETAAMNGGGEMTTALFESIKKKFLFIDEVEIFLSFLIKYQGFLPLNKGIVEFGSKKIYS